MPQSQPDNPSYKRDPLKWRFVAHFSDGTSYEQPADDRSKNHIEGAEHNPSSFRDVLDREDELVAFALVHEDGKQSVVVDLITGAFVVNGTPLIAHNQAFEPEKYDLELVYFRETHIAKNLATNVTHHYVNRYFVGWKTDVNGKSKQVTIAVG